MLAQLNIFRSTELARRITRTRSEQCGKRKGKLQLRKYVCLYVGEWSVIKLAFRYRGQ